MCIVQDVSRVERERQRAAQQVQQLQSSLTAMRAEQEALRKRLQERLLAQEKSAADKAKELAALRRAGRDYQATKALERLWKGYVVCKIVHLAFVAVVRVG